MNPKKTPMPGQDPLMCSHNFGKAILGYTGETTMEEAQRCLQRKHKPCISGCPVNIKISEFIRCIIEGDLEQTYHIITSINSLSTVHGRVCPQEAQCETECVHGIKHELVGIGCLKRYITDRYTNNHERKPVKTEQNGYKVVIINASPTDLTCAGDLNAMGHSVAVSETLHTAGGVLMYGIPQFRLSKEIIQKEIDLLRSNGVTIETDMVIGKALSVDGLFEMDSEVAFIGFGAGLSSFMNVPGEDPVDVYSANEFLTCIDPMKVHREGYDIPAIRPKNVTVCGDGNVAIDAARSTKRLGAENIYIVYRRMKEQIPAHREKIHHAKEEEIDLRLLTNPVVIHGDENGRVIGIRCIRMELSEPDVSGRRKPVEVEGSNFRLSVDCIVMAIGNSPNPLLRRTAEGFETNHHGCLIVNEETPRTTRKDVFAGGDAVTGAVTVILTMGEGKYAVNSTNEYIKSKK